MIQTTTSAGIAQNPMLPAVLSQEDYIKQLEGLVCALANCYEKCKETYFDKHLNTASRANENRRDLTEQEQSEINRFPLIQGTANQFAVEKMSKSNKKPTMSLTELANCVTA